MGRRMLISSRGGIIPMWDKPDPERVRGLIGHKLCIIANRALLSSQRVIGLIGHKPCTRQADRIMSQLHKFLIYEKSYYKMYIMEGYGKDVQIRKRAKKCHSFHYLTITSKKVL